MTSTLLGLALALVTISQGTLVNRTADYGTEPTMIDRTLSRTSSLEYVDNAYRNFLVHKKYIESLEEERESLREDKIKSLREDEIDNLIEDKIDNLREIKIDNLREDKIDNLRNEEKESLRQNKIKNFSDDKMHNLSEDKIDDLRNNKKGNIREDLKQVRKDTIDNLSDKPINNLTDETIGDLEDRIESFREERFPWQSDNLRRVKRGAAAVEEEQDPRCEKFLWGSKDQTFITHPHNKDTGTTNYYSGINCVTVINGGEGTVVQLTFVDMFHIEDHPDCDYDFLEIRDGEKGYAKILDKVCGEAFPRQITTSGPYVWLKFKSDDTIEYEGFRINIQFIPTSTSISIPKSCYVEMSGMHGVIDSDKISEDCKTRSANQALDVLWTIKAPENHKINLNFTSYSLAKPNDCEDNLVQVFGYVLEYPAKIAHYCGSVANAVNTKGSDGKGGKDEKGNIMYVRLYASKVGKGSMFNATFTAYRTLDPNKDEKCDPETEFNCEDNTCIDVGLRCDKYAHCRLKADEETELCKDEAESTISKPHILTILIIFSLILSGMSFVFLFKCIRKLYQDHKIIKEHIKQSCEDRLDTLANRLTLDAKRLQRDSEPRASLERDNHTNEMFKQQRHMSQQRRPTSIDSDLIQETRLDMDDPWRRDVESIPREPEDARPERNGVHEEKRRMRRDTSRKEDSLRKSKDEKREERREIRDVSVGAPDTKESGCQTRESLFQTDTTVSSDGSNTTNSRGFSTFGYSGATIVQPPPTTTSQITIELLSQVAPETKPKKLPDRRPMSTETTRSAPDVIIVSKPVR